MGRIRVWRVKAMFRDLDRRHLERRIRKYRWVDRTRAAGLRLEGAFQLLDLPERRRARLLPLVREQWLAAVAEDPHVVLPALAEVVVKGPDYATDEFVDQVLARWIRYGWPYRLERDVYEQLGEALATTGRSLAERLADLYRTTDAAQQEEESTHRIRRMLMDYHPEQPPMDLLVAIGPLRSEADWWCDLGYHAIEAGDLDRAQRHFARANDLGSPHVRERVAYLAVLRVEEDADRAQVREALMTAREVHPSLNPEQLFYLGCRAVLAGLEPDLPDERTPAGLSVDRPDLLQLWLAQHALRAGKHTEARARLRECVRKARKLTKLTDWPVVVGRAGDPSASDVRVLASAQLARLRGKPAPRRPGHGPDDPDARFLPSVFRLDPGWLHEAPPTP
ncbi:hypothetical protein ACIRYZ_44865 [Kitasatospora sp. NPDC101155]|uniref:hypothetical protein n=1 Tax=Kitasatospora sp. NPDC101155 TaxID=3364097 RepID=UPI00382CE3B8